MNVTQTAADMRTRERAVRVAALREGRKQRAVRFTDRKKESARVACRGKVLI